jgi:hypothetical protein
MGRTREDLFGKKEILRGVHQVLNGDLPNAVIEFKGSDEAALSYGPALENPASSD